MTRQGIIEFHDSRFHQSRASHAGHQRTIEPSRLRTFVHGVGRYGLLVFALAMMTVSAAWAQSSETAFTRWIATATTPFEGPLPSDAAPPAFANQTIRQVMHISAGGDLVRVRLSNQFGTEPLVIGEAHVALHASGAAIVSGTDRKLTFSGRRSVTIPAGRTVASDPLPFRVAALSDLAVSIYVPSSTGPATFFTIETTEGDEPSTYLSEPGNFAAATSLPVSEPSRFRVWISSIEVATRDRAEVVVAIGDSIMEGRASNRFADRNWPSFLSTRLNATHERPRLSVVNQGIGCNRLLRDVCGPSGVARFERDVLSVSGVTHVIVGLGLVDFAFATVVGDPTQVTSAEEVIAGLQELIARARARGLKVYGVTLTPSEGSTFPNFFTPENEAKRQIVNAWIRSSNEYDGVIDADAAIRDPSHPTRMLPAFATSDNTHPNDAGFAAIVESIDLSMFR